MGFVGDLGYMYTFLVSSGRRLMLWSLIEVSFELKSPKSPTLWTQLACVR
jgi:hypothetical protein